MGFAACAVGASDGFAACGAAASEGLPACKAGTSPGLLALTTVALAFVTSLPVVAGDAFEAFAALGSRFSILVPPPVLLELDSPSAAVLFSILVPPPVLLLELALPELAVPDAVLLALALPLALAAEVESVTTFLPKTAAFWLLMAAVSGAFSMRMPPPVPLELALLELAPLALAALDAALLELALALPLAFAEAVSVVPFLANAAVFWPLDILLVSAVFSMRIPPPVLLPEPLLLELPLLELALLEELLLVLPFADVLASVVPLLLEFALLWFALGSIAARSIRVPPPVLPLALLLLELLPLDDPADASVPLVLSALPFATFGSKFVGLSAIRWPEGCCSGEVAAMCALRVS
jgi:hypothetical protein